MSKKKKKSRSNAAKAAAKRQPKKQAIEIQPLLEAEAPKTPVVATKPRPAPTLKVRVMQKQKRQWLATPAERLAIALGGLLLVVGIVGVWQRPAPGPVSTDVKQQSIPMTLDDFKDDPAIQHAIQKQLGGTSNAAPTPQSQPGESPQNAGSTLQAPANSLQP